MAMKPNFPTLRSLITGTLLACSLHAQESLPTLRVGVSPTMPPMIFKEGQTISGVEADLAKALGREIGRSVSFVEMPWVDLIDSLEADKIDIIMSSMSITRARQTRVAFSTPYCRIGQKALVRAPEKFRYSTLATSLSEQTVGVIRATTADLLVQQNFPKAKRKYFTSGEDAAKALARKKIDLYFSDSTLIWFLAGKYEAEGLVATPSVLSDEMIAWAVRRSSPELLSAVNKALQSMTASGEVNRVLRTWIPQFE